jgi:Asp-tRNA(Asn)/Glu-tRNA(Gln) amidotransferase B subunit
VAAQNEVATGLTAASFAALLAMEAGGQLSATQSKTVLGALLERGGDPAALAKEMGFEALGSDTLSAVLDEVIAAHPDEWARYVAGEDKMTGVFTGAVMKATSGKANGKEVAAELRRRRG